MKTQYIDYSKSECDKRVEIKILFHKLWTKAAVKSQDYDKKEWQKLADLLRHHNIEIQ
jgi:hypothetical protein